MIEKNETFGGTWPYKANFCESAGFKQHYVDEGPRDGEVIYLLHGEPVWSYLFRKMIPILTDAGYRVIAPDMVGFGKSDKYISIDDYSHQMHVDTMTKLIQKLDLRKYLISSQFLNLNKNYHK